MLLDRLLNCSVPQFPYLYNGYDNKPNLQGCAEAQRSRAVQTTESGKDWLLLLQLTPDLKEQMGSCDCSALADEDVGDLPRHSTRSGRAWGRAQDRVLSISIWNFSTVIKIHPTTAYFCSILSELIVAQDYLSLKSPRELCMKMRILAVPQAQSSDPPR
jgi:hypothetical protein